MKKILTTAITAAILFASTGAIAEAPKDSKKFESSQGTIKFKGTVNSNSCDVTLSNETVTLDPINKKNIQHIDSFNPKNSIGKEFDIKLSDCDANIATANVKLSSAGLRDPRVLDNTSSGSTAAKNIGILIAHNNAPVKLDSSSVQTVTIKKGNREGKSTYTAYYVKTEKDTTSGLIEAQANYNITYK